MKVNIRKSGYVLVIVVFTMMFIASAAVAEEKFPTRPVSLEACFGPGGGSDTMARTMEPALKKALGVSLNISNTSGAGGDVGLGKALAGKADGYTVFFQNSNSIMKIAMGKSPFKRSQIQYLCRAHMSNFWLFIHTKDKKFSDWKGVVKYAKANPGKLTVSAEGLGGMDEMAMRFLAENGIKLTIVPYGKPAERYIALVGQHEDMLIEQIGDVIGFIKDKRIKPVLVFAKERAKGFEDVPCSYDVGLKYDVMQFRGYGVKVGTPKDRVKILAAAWRKAYMSDKYQKALKTWQVDPEKTWLGPEEYGAFVDKSIKDIATMAKKYGIGK